MFSTLGSLAVIHSAQLPARLANTLRALGHLMPRQTAQMPKADSEWPVYFFLN
jgi:hypothetical protein